MATPADTKETLNIFKSDVAEAGSIMLSMAEKTEDAQICDDFFNAMAYSILSSVPFSSNQIEEDPDIRVISGQAALNIYIRIQMGHKKRKSEFPSLAKSVGSHLASDFIPLQNQDPDGVEVFGIPAVKSALKTVSRSFPTTKSKKEKHNLPVHILMLPAGFRPNHSASVFIFGGKKPTGYIIAVEEPSEKTAMHCWAALVAGLTACSCDCTQAYNPEHWQTLEKKFSKRKYRNPKGQVNDPPIVFIFAQPPKSQATEVLNRLDITTEFYRPAATMIFNAQREMKNTT